jgi:hypothetical protein
VLCSRARPSLPAEHTAQTPSLPEARARAYDTSLRPHDGTRDERDHRPRVHSHKPTNPSARGARAVEPSAAAARPGGQRGCAAAPCASAPLPPSTRQARQRPRRLGQRGHNPHRQAAAALHVCTLPGISVDSRQQHPPRRPRLADSSTQLHTGGR